MLFVLFVFIFPSIICALLGFYFCIHHNTKQINDFEDLINLDKSSNLFLLKQNEKNYCYSQTPLLLNNGLNNNNLNKRLIILK
ncbi:hypothetical protein Mgra_00003111 [Meloidogyne graminicola]|uniref:Uncharacterized protein n=1 Tax=Meloidogyne graminicola TaxID=189291 RepID=A0A8S9ZW65_9BILA|nr:hypothetical protein Mgra_00003111 [Meloidogyne graminicola]